MDLFNRALGGLFVVFAALIVVVVDMENTFIEFFIPVELFNRSVGELVVSFVVAVVVDMEDT